VKDETFWVENASVEWPEDQAPFHVVARLTLDHGSRLTDEECDQFYIDVTEHSTPDTHPLGSINRARWFAESASRRVRLHLPATAPARVGAVVDPTAVPDSRYGAPLPVPAAPRGSWIGGITLGAIGRTALTLAFRGALAGWVVVMLMMLYVEWGGGMLPAEHVDRVDYPNRGWGAGVDAPGRQTFYYTAQGAGLKDIRYQWFVHLEMPWGKQRITDPVVMSRYGFLSDPMTAANPDRLPVGFTHHFDQGLNEELLDVTCAACHTGQIQITRNGYTRALRIDGGSADHAFTTADLGHFLPTLIASMGATWANPLKFNRFAKAVLGDQYPSGLWHLHSELGGVIATFVGLGVNEKVLAAHGRIFTVSPHGLSPTAEGYARTDALVRIANTVFGDNLSSTNYAVGDGPVNYPPLWNIWKFDWVQYNASVSQPMARNIGESMGVGAKYAFVNGYGNPQDTAQRYRSTALIHNLDEIENTLRALKPPAWPEDMLGAIDTARAAKGKRQFNQYCVGCHGPHIAPDAIKTRDAPLKKANQPEWLLATLCTNDIATDSNTAHNFATARVDITRTGMTALDLRRVADSTAWLWNARQAKYLGSEIARLRAFPDSVAALRADSAGLADATQQQVSQLDPAHLPVGNALSYLGTMIREKAYADAGYTQAERDSLDGFGALDMPQVIEAYRSRPLGGMWATPPFLHNGSVPTVWDLLGNPKDRPKTFQVGSHEYDPVHLGLAKVKGFWTYDTSKPGNHNTGHEFGEGYDSTKHDAQVRPGLIGPLLADSTKLQIIEYLKIRDDDADAPKTPNIPHTCAPPSTTVPASSAKAPGRKP
jgi:hypothetical protein